MNLLKLILVQSGLYLVNCSNYANKIEYIKKHFVGDVAITTPMIIDGGIATSEGNFTKAHLRDMVWKPYTMKQIEFNNTQIQFQAYKENYYYDDLITLDEGSICIGDFEFCTTNGKSAILPVIRNSANLELAADDWLTLVNTQNLPMRLALRHPNVIKTFTTAKDHNLNKIKPVFWHTRGRMLIVKVHDQAPEIKMVDIWLALMTTQNTVDGILFK